MFTVKPDPGIVAKSFKQGDPFYIGEEKLLPLSRFTNPGGSSGGRGRYVCLQSEHYHPMQLFSSQPSFHLFTYILEEVDVVVVAVEVAVEAAVVEGMQHCL